MDDVEDIRASIDRGEPLPAARLLPMVYGELHRLAAQRLAHEKPGQTLQATALVHEAYLRLVGDADPGWDGRGHFFAAAAEAMRRILVEQARRRDSQKRGGHRERLPLEDCEIAAPEPVVDLLALDDALTQLAAEEPEAARLVELRHFAGLTMPEAADALGLSLSTAERRWRFARAYLSRKMSGADT